MCEHEFEWGKVLREHCPKCSTTLYEQDLEQQLAAAKAELAAETIMLKKLQICATCHQYDPVDEWDNDKIHACKANKKLENVSSHDKCIQWEIARWL